MNKFITDTYVIAKNELMVQVRNPLWLFFGLFQPLVYMVLFSPFLAGIANSPGFPASSAIQFFAPGLLMMNALFGSSFAGFALIDQLRIGFIERIRVTPVDRLAVAIGLIFRTPVVLVTQSIILIIVALFFGLKVSFIGLIIVVLLVALIGVTLASLSYTIALIVKEEGTLAAITNFFTLPLMLLSGVMLPITFAPGWIKKVAVFNPFTYAVNASRALINGTFSDPAVITAFILFIIIGGLTLTWFVRSMRNAVA